MYTNILSFCDSIVGIFHFFLQDLENYILELIPTLPQVCCMQGIK